MRKLTKSKRKSLIDTLGHRVQKHDLINSLLQEIAGITLGRILQSEVDFAKKDLERILSRRKTRSSVNFADEGEVHRISMSRLVMVRVKVYSEDTLALFESVVIPNDMSVGMFHKLNVRTTPKRRRIKVAKFDLEPCLRALTRVPVVTCELTVAQGCRVIEELIYYVAIGFPVIIKLRARLDYYRMLFKIHFKVDSEILNYGYERESGGTKGDGFILVKSEDTYDREDVGD